MNESKQISKMILDSSKLPVLGAVILSYFVGGGVAAYLGRNINWLVFWLGLWIVLLFLLSSEYLSVTFLYSSRKANVTETLRQKAKTIFLQLGLVGLTVGAVLTVFLFSLINENFVVWLFLGLFFVVNIISVIPPLDLRNRGYGDLLHTINLVILTPALAQGLQLLELNRSTIMITYPVFFLVLAAFLAFSLESYAADIQSGRKTLMTISGWKIGMNLHNLFLLLTYFLFALLSVINLSFVLLLPAIYAFPFSGLQFWEMWRIGNGAKPRWNFLKFTALASGGVMVYVWLYNFWFR